MNETKELVEFANYMMKKVKSGEKKADPSGDFEVTDADLSNWKYEVAEKN